MRGLKLAIVAAVGLALLFIAFGGLHLGYSARSIGLLGAVGFSIGAMAAPALEPRHFRHPTLWQVGFSVAGCVAVALLLSARGEGLALAVVVGVVMGVAAPAWLKHVQLP